EPAVVGRDAGVVVERMPHRALARAVLPIVAAGRRGAGRPDVADALLGAGAGEDGEQPGGLTTGAPHLRRNGRPVRLREREGDRRAEADEGESDDDDEEPHGGPLVEGL